MEGGTVPWAGLSLGKARTEGKATSSEPIHPAQFTLFSLIFPTGGALSLVPSSPFKGIKSPKIKTTLILEINNIFVWSFKADTAGAQMGTIWKEEREENAKRLSANGSGIKGINICAGKNGKKKTEKGKGKTSILA